MTTLSPKTFRFALDRGVGTITLDRPHRLNSLTFESYVELGAFFPELERHPEDLPQSAGRPGQAAVTADSTAAANSAAAEAAAEAAP